MPRKPDDLFQQPGKAFHQRTVCGKTHFTESLGNDIVAIPPGHGFSQRINLFFLKTQHFADITYRTAPSVADDCGGKCCAMTAVFVIDVLNNFFAAFVFKVDIDIWRFVAFL